MAGAAQSEKGTSIRLGPRHPATQFLLRLAVMAIVAVICDQAFPESTYKSYIIFGCFIIGAAWLYIDASQVAAVRIAIDPGHTKMLVERQFILRRERDVLALANVAGLDIHWSDGHESLEAQDLSLPSPNSVTLVTKDGRRIVLMAPGQMSSASATQIKAFERAFGKALGRQPT